jgi:hypothetical protein
MYLMQLLSELKWPLGRPISRWEANNTIDLKERNCEVKHYIQTSQDRTVWLAVLKRVNELSDYIKDRKCFDQLSDNQKSSSLYRVIYGNDKFHIKFHTSG